MCSFLITTNVFINFKLKSLNELQIIYFTQLIILDTYFNYNIISIKTAKYPEIINGARGSMVDK